MIYHICDHVNNFLVSTTNYALSLVAIIFHSDSLPHESSPINQDPVISHLIFNTIFAYLYITSVPYKDSA